MKTKHLLLALSIILFSIKSYAQNKDYFEWGIKAGANISEITKYEGAPFVGFNAGIYDEFALSEKIVIRSELIFSLQGESKDNNIPSVTLQYINFPVLAKYYFTDRISAEAGLEMDYLLKAKNLIIEDKVSKRFEFAVAIGGNYRLTEKLEIGIRYHLGLSEIPVENNNDFYNSVTQISLGYAF